MMTNTFQDLSSLQMKYISMALASRCRSIIGTPGIAEMNGVESMKSASQTECQCVHQPTHEMTTDEIKEMAGFFISGAKRLKEAGVDAVELHGAHGYLIGQFLSPYTKLKDRRVRRKF